jgi:hypothetical protein
MPIRPEFRHFYRGAAWRAVRDRIRARAGDRCERCHKPNGVKVETVVGQRLFGARSTRYMFWRVPGADIWHSHLGEIKSKPHPGAPAEFRQTAARTIRVKCACAHLNHTPGDDRDENLAWLCDWCHFHWDQEHHRGMRAARKDRDRPILAAASREVA